MVSNNYPLNPLCKDKGSVTLPRVRGLPCNVSSCNRNSFVHFHRRRTRKHPMCSIWAWIVRTHLTLMQELERRHVRPISDIEEQRDVVVHHKVEMILAVDMVSKSIAGVSILVHKQVPLNLPSLGFLPFGYFKRRLLWNDVIECGFKVRILRESRRSRFARFDCN